VENIRECFGGNVRGLCPGNFPEQMSRGCPGCVSGCPCMITSSNGSVSVFEVGIGFSVFLSVFLKY